MIDNPENFTGVCNTNIFSITFFYFFFNLFSLFLNLIFKYFVFFEVQKYIIQIVTNNMFVRTLN